MCCVKCFENTIWFFDLIIFLSFILNWFETGIIIDQLQPLKFALALGNCWEKFVFSLMWVSKLLLRLNCLNIIHVYFWINYWKSKKIFIFIYFLNKLFFLIYVSALDNIHVRFSAKKIQSSLGVTLHSLLNKGLDEARHIV